MSSLARVWSDVMLSLLVHAACKLSPELRERVALLCAIRTTVSRWLSATVGQRCSYNFNGQQADSSGTYRDDADGWKDAAVQFAMEPAKPDLQELTLQAHGKAPVTLRIAVMP